MSQRSYLYLLPKFHNLFKLMKYISKNKIIIRGTQLPNLKKEPQYLLYVIQLEAEIGGVGGRITPYVRNGKH